MKYTIMAILLSTAVCNAGESQWGRGSSTTIFSTSPDAIIFDSSEGSYEVFRMSPGACLRGPLVFKRKTGEEIFKLESGVEFPTRCGDRR